MFGSNSDLEKEVESLTKRLERMKEEHTLSLEREEHKHSMELDKLNYKLENVESEKLRAAERKIAGLEQEVAVMKKENVLLERLIDFNGDLVDMKQLISNLMAKLPQIDLKNLTIMQNGDSRK